MEWLNYHHLLYFWVVAREGSIKRACEELRLAQPTISTQLRIFEETLGEKLFTRRNRRLILTDVGHVVYRYADEIFSLGKELTQTLQGMNPGRPIRLTVGVAEGVPKLVAYRLLESGMRIPSGVRIVCLEGRFDRLLADLATHALDVVVADMPVPPTMSIQAYSHLLGRSKVTVFASTKIAAAYRKGFPKSLDRAPFLLPTRNAALRRSMDEWFMVQGIEPIVVGEFEDSAMQTAFGQAGLGLFPGSTALEKEIMRQYQVRIVGRLEQIQERFYAITVERLMKHPAVVRIAESAQQHLPAEPSVGDSSGWASD